MATAFLAGVMLQETFATPAAAEWSERRVWEWQTWVIKSPNEFRVSPPPNTARSALEVEQLQSLVAKRTSAELDTIAYWDTVGPSYRWNEIAVNLAVKLGLPGISAFRNLALLHAAINDAMVVVWHNKHIYNRSRPSVFSEFISTVVTPDPESSSYPSEEVAAAGVASEVLSYLFPPYAQYFARKAEEVARCQLLSGVAYPSDLGAGFELGRQIAERVIDRAKQDGSDLSWTGSVPIGPGKWNGNNPLLPSAGTWRTWTLSSPHEFRPSPPLSYDSTEKNIEIAELKQFRRTAQTDSLALFWEYAAGGSRNFQYWLGQTSKLILENGFGKDPARAARYYALVSITLADAGVACWDAKYTYWAARPDQLDSGLTPLFATPNHPSYPSGHSCWSHAAAAILGFLFPREAPALHALAHEISESRVWAGIHFRSDIVAGRALGIAVANKLIERARPDEAQ